MAWTMGRNGRRRRPGNAAADMPAKAAMSCTRASPTRRDSSGWIVQRATLAAEQLLQHVAEQRDRMLLGVAVQAVDHFVRQSHRLSPMETG
jgi:hypothetical protein